MSCPETISIDNVEYIRKDSINKTLGPIKIVVLDKGFVYVGNVEIDSTGIEIKNAKNIRYWGTTKGLGELVKGPTNSTKLDFAGTVRASTFVLLIDVEQLPWKVI